jgi:Ca2+-binding EF-hand superfamily protein
MDSNHDGLITIEDLQVAKKKHYVDGTNWKELLIKLDLDGNGKIDFEEFLVAATDH